MNLDIHAVRLSGALRKIGEFRDPDAILLHVDQALVTVSWNAIRLTGRAPIQFGRRGPGLLLVDDVAVDDAWTVLPELNQVLLVRGGEFLFFDPAQHQQQQAPRTIRIDGLRGGTFGISLDGDAKRALLVVVRDVNPDFSEYTVVAADLDTGRVNPQKAIRGNGELEVVWDPKAGAWFICNTSNATVWRWDGSGTAEKFAPPEQASLHAPTLSADKDGVMITALTDDASGGKSLITARIESGRPVWSQPVPLPGGSAILARRHPTLPVWACLAYEGAGQQIQIRDAAGKLQVAAAVPPAGLLNHLLWSTSSPSRLWGLGTRVLLEASLVESPAVPVHPIPPKPKAGLPK